MSTCNRLDFRITWIFDRLCPKTSGAVVPRVPLPRPRIRQRCHETAHQVHKFIGGWCMVTTKSDNMFELKAYASRYWCGLLGNAEYAGTSKGQSDCSIPAGPLRRTYRFNNELKKKKRDRQKAQPGI